MKIEQAEVFRCEFCGKRRFTRKAMENHERWCQCKACKHYEPPEDPRTEQPSCMLFDLALSPLESDLNMVPEYPCPDREVAHERV